MLDISRDKQNELELDRTDLMLSGRMKNISMCPGKETGIFREKAWKCEVPGLQFSGTIVCIDILRPVS